MPRPRRAGRAGDRTAASCRRHAAPALALYPAGLVDLRQRLREAGERVGIGGGCAAGRGAFNDRLLAFGERLDHRLVGGGIARPGAVLVGEQREGLAVDGEIGVRALFEKIARGEAHLVGALLAGPMGDAGEDRGALGASGLALARLADEIADLRALSLILIGV